MDRKLRPMGEDIAVKYKAVRKESALDRLARDQRDNAHRVRRYPCRQNMWDLCEFGAQLLKKAAVG